MDSYYDMFWWVSVNAVVDVPDWDEVPSEVRHRLHHVHSGGECVKNRQGDRCPSLVEVGVDNR